MSIVVVGRCAYECISKENWLKNQTSHKIEIKDVYCSCQDCWERKAKEEKERKKDGANARAA